MIYQGIGASEGAAFGKAVVFRHSPQPQDIVRKDAGIDPGTEMDLFFEAREKIFRDLQSMATEAQANFGGDKAGIFEGFAEILMDAEIEHSVRAFIGQGRSAAEAVRDTLKTLEEEFRALEDAYMRERASDIADIGRKMVSAINGDEQTLPVINEPCILVADDLSPFETVRLNHAFIKAIAVDMGGTSGHVAILSRSLGIPCAVGLKNASDSVQDGMGCAVNGSSGIFITEPDQQTIDSILLDEQERLRNIKAMSRHAAEPALTKDGISIKVCANTGSLEESRLALGYGADGIGLLRTELIYMEKDTLPGEDEQFEIYRSIAELMGSRTLTIRSLDIGGDKDFPALGLVKEVNPFLGYRAIRVGLKRPEILKPQLRAILRAARYGTIELMFPLIISLEELMQATHIVDECREELRREGKEFGEPAIGIMVETPAAAIMSPALAGKSAFFSIGTNDLTQYTLAVDRGNSEISDLYDSLNPAILRMIALSSEAAAKAGIPIGICGELASDPGAVPVLLGLGLSKLSVTPSRIPAIKECIRKLDMRVCRESAGKVLAMERTSEIRGFLDQFRG